MSGSTRLLGGIRQRGRGTQEQVPTGRGRARGIGLYQLPKKEPKPAPTQREIEARRSEILKRETSLPSLTIVKSAISLYSFEEMLKIAAVKVNNQAPEGENTVNDPRMGVVSTKDPCHFCSSIDCTGHFGIIEFHPDFYIYNPAYIRQIISVLKCVCNDCNRLLLNEDDIIQAGWSRLNFEKRLAKMETHCEEMGCLRDHGNIKGGDITPCRQNPIFLTSEIKEKGEITYKLRSDQGKKKGEDSSIRIMSIEKVKTILDHITDSDARLLGFPPGTHPRNMIMSGILVPPNIARPHVYENGNLVYDTLTVMFMAITRKVADVKMGKAPASEVYALIKQLIYKTDGKKLGMRDFKSIIDLIQGKSALLRGLLMGKRNNYCGRTVAGPDPSLEFGQIRLPAVWDNVLTKRINVARFNIIELTKLLDPDNPQITHITSHDGLRRRYNPRMGARLKIGDKVDRCMQNGDRVVINRQPTLHKQSMMGYVVVLGRQLTIGSHLSYTTPMNCDFDGDENNTWDPQDFEVEAEVATLLNVKNNIMSSEQNKPIMGLVMNSIVGAYLLTQPENKKEGIEEPRMDQDLFDSLMFMIKDKEALKTLYGRLIKYGIHPMSGKAVFSALLPPDFYYRNKGVLILEGILVSGQLKKSHVGTSHRSIIQELWKKYGAERTADFFTEAPWVINKWLIERGFTVGLRDVLNTYTDADGNLKDKNKEILQKELAKIYVELEAIGGKSDDPLEELYRQKRINNVVNIAAGIGFELANKVLTGKNSLAAMTEKGSGSKGALGNIGQIMGAVGQQFYRGQILKPTISNGRRLLPAFDLDDNDPNANGFIPVSFFTGMDAVGLHFLQAGGREGLLDTALKTAETGRMQHLMIKAFEGAVIGYDGSIRDTVGTMFAPIYNSGYDTAEMVEIEDKLHPQFSSFIDIKSMVEELNVRRGWVPKDTVRGIDERRRKLLKQPLPKLEHYMEGSNKDEKYNPKDFGPILQNTDPYVDVTQDVVRQQPYTKINKFEKSRIIGARATQLSNNAPPIVDIGDEIDPVKIALMEYETGELPIYIIRKYPNGDHEKVYATLDTISPEYPIQ